MTEIRKVFLGSDHAGFTLKTKLMEFLLSEFASWEIEDLGCESEASVDYPDYGKKVGKSVVQTPGSKGILVCGSGIGVCISANKIRGIRAASSWDATSARLSRQHNDANIVCIGARLTGLEVALEITRTFLKTPFEGGRHQKRIDLITRLEGL
jgi:ribose 5-phosphate isomerase B